MAEVMQLSERPLEAAGPGSEEVRRELRVAKAFLVTGLVWAAVVMLGWLFWWLVGPGGREQLSQTMALSAAQMSHYMVIFLGVEKLAAKGLLFAALYH